MEGELKPVVLSGEFRVEDNSASPDGGFVAEFIGNDVAADVGNGGGATVAEALENALRDYLLTVGWELVGFPAPWRRV